MKELCGTAGHCAGISPHSPKSCRPIRSRLSTPYLGVTRGRHNYRSHAQLSLAKVLEHIFCTSWSQMGTAILCQTLRRKGLRKTRLRLRVRNVQSIHRPHGTCDDAFLDINSQLINAVMSASVARSNASVPMIMPTASDVPP